MSERPAHASLNKPAHAGGGKKPGEPRFAGQRIGTPKKIGRPSGRKDPITKVLASSL